MMKLCNRIYAIFHLLTGRKIKTLFNKILNSIDPGKLYYSSIVNQIL